MDLCPDNSTSCLLRLILDTLANADQEYNWDPLTFAFTVAIGVLAFIVACLTVFQGCLAAGPGRLKAGASAIGPWAAESKLSFDWRLFAVRTKTRTPLIDLEQVIDPLKRMSEGADNKSTPLLARTRPVLPMRQRYEKLLHSLFFGHDESEVQERQHREDFYNASWMNLLLRAGLVDTQLFASTNLWRTDYLSDSLQAAPAFGTMRSLVFLAIYANDSSSIQPPNTAETRLFTVQGLTSDLTSQSLETVGPVAAYVSYGRPKSLLCELDRMDLLPAYADLVASYQLCYHNTIPSPVGKLDILSSDGNTDSARIRRELRLAASCPTDLESFFAEHSCPLLLALCFGNILYRPRAFPKKRKGLVGVVHKLAQHSMWEYRMPPRFRDSFTKFSQEVVGKLAKDRQQKAWLFPKRPQMPFLKLKNIWQPTGEQSADSHRKVVADMMRIIKSCHTWSWIEDDSVVGVESLGSKPPSKPSTPGLEPSDWDAKVEVASIVYVLTRTILTSSKSDLEQFGNKSILETLRGNRLVTHEFMTMLQNEVLCIDKWLRRKEYNMMMCALMVLSKLSEIEEAQEPSQNISLDSRGRKKDQGKPYGKRLGDESKKGGDLLSSRERSRGKGNKQQQRREWEPCFRRVPQDKYDKAIRSAFIYIGTDLEGMRSDRDKNLNSEQGNDETAQMSSSRADGNSDVPPFPDDDSDNVDSETEKSSRAKSYKGKEKFSMMESLLDRNSPTAIDFWNTVEVLRYRALLYAAILDLCADSSWFGWDYVDFTVKII